MLSLQHKFHVSALYRQPVETMRGYLSKRWSFWLALFSCIAFLIGNMVGQHGFDAFWKSVWGKEDDLAIVFTGTAPPIASIPDPERWNGDSRAYSFSDVPKSLLIPFPAYSPVKDCTEDSLHDRRVISIDYNGDYKSGCLNSGSHPANDILVPVGTPVSSIANGVVERTEERTWGFGHTIVIRHPNVPDPSDANKKTSLYSSYAHLSSILVNVGEVVSKGQQIALSGQTGFATAPHLHIQLDKDSAPFHPYWPFTTSDAADAGVDFVGAVNKGLGQDRAKEFTLNPLAFVEAYKSGIETRSLVASNNDSGNGSVQDIVVGSVHITKKDAKIKRSLIPSPQELWRLARAKVRVRRAERMAKMKNTSSTSVVLVKSEAVTRSMPDIISPNVTDTAMTSNQEETQPPIVATNSVITKEVPIPKEVGKVSSISILHDGEFDSEWEQLVLFARDGDGNFVQNVKFDGEIQMSASFGYAQFSPAVVTSEQFDDRGRAFIQMLPSGTKTVVPSVSGVFNTRGEPVVYQTEGTKVSQR